MKRMTKGGRKERREKGRRTVKTRRHHDRSRPRSSVRSRPGDGSTRLETHTSSQHRSLPSYDESAELTGLGTSVIFCLFVPAATSWNRTRSLSFSLYPGILRNARSVCHHQPKVSDLLRQARGTVRARLTSHPYSILPSIDPSLLSFLKPISLDVLVILST